MRGNLINRYKREAVKYKITTIALSAVLVISAGSVGISSFAAKKDSKLVDSYFYDSSADDNYILGEYNWCLYDSVGNRNDLTVDNIRMIKELCKDYNLPVEVVLGIVMAGSDGYNYTKDSKSTAMGLFQVTYDTGKAYFDKYMADGKEYNHSDNLSSAFNIKLGVTILGEMYKESGSLLGAIQRYKGMDSIADFTKKINKFMSRKDLVLSDYIMN